MTTIKSKQTSAILGVLTLVAIVALSPHAFAQQGPSSSGQGQQGGIPLGGNYGVTTQSPASPDAVVAAWGTMIAVVAVMSGVGIWSAVRKHKV